MEAQAKFLEGNLFKHIAVMSLTASVGLMAVFLVDFIDMIFISMLGKAELAAAIGYAGALLFFTSSFGIGMAIAAGALVARALGAGDEDLARRRATNTLIYGVIFGAIFSLLVWFNLRPLSAMLGASGETLELSVSYLAIIIPSLPLLIFGMVGSAVLRAYGDARRAPRDDGDRLGRVSQRGSRPHPDLWARSGTDWRGSRLGRRARGNCLVRDHAFDPPP